MFELNRFLSLQAWSFLPFLFHSNLFFFPVSAAMSTMLVILIPKSTVDLISNKVESKFILLALIQSEMQSEALLVVD